MTSAGSYLRLDDLPRLRPRTVCPHLHVGYTRIQQNTSDELSTAIWAPPGECELFLASQVVGVPTTAGNYVFCASGYCFDCGYHHRHCQLTFTDCVTRDCDMLRRSGANMRKAENAITLAS